jgi:hypothetical protein
MKASIAVRSTPPELGWTFQIYGSQACSRKRAAHEPSIVLALLKCPEFVCYILQYMNVRSKDLQLPYLSTRVSLRRSAPPYSVLKSVEWPLLSSLCLVYLLQIAQGPDSLGLSTPNLKFHSQNTRIVASFTVECDQPTCHRVGSANF